MTFPDRQQIETFMKALGSESRISILLLFMDGRARTVNEVAEGAKLGQSTCSEHLAKLKRAGIMQSQRQGKEVYYLPDRDRITEQLDALSSLLKGCC